MDKMKNLPKFYVINLKRATNRLEYVSNLFKKYNIDYEIVEAIDGKSDNLDNICAIKHSMKNGMDKKILATTISHLKAIKTFADDKNNDNTTYAMITEDDVAFDFCEYWDSSFDEIVQ